MIYVDDYAFITETDEKKRQDDKISDKGRYDLIENNLLINEDKTERQLSEERQRNKKKLITRGSKE